MDEGKATTRAPPCPKINNSMSRPSEGLYQRRCSRCNGSWGLGGYVLGAKDTTNCVSGKWLPFLSPSTSLAPITHHLISSPDTETSALRPPARPTTARYAGHLRLRRSEGRDRRPSPWPRERREECERR